MAEARLETTLFFDGDDPLYQDHFPGNPVVPGTLVVEGFLEYLKAQGYTPLAISNFRFRVFISPGRYHAEVRVDKQKASCILFNGDGKRAVTGHVEIS